MDKRVTREQLTARKRMPLEIKIAMSLSRIRQWYYDWGGEVYVSFSGGMDSTVLLHLVRTEFPDVLGVCVDSGLLYPEIRAHVKAVENTIVVRPDKTFRQVIDEYGYPIISKRVAQYIHEVKTAKGNTATRKLRLTGIRSDGTFSKLGMIPRKWQFLCDAPFKISDKCCYWIKKRPLKRIAQEYGKPFVGTRADEGSQRELTYLQYGCNAYDTKHPRSTPIAFWTDEDIWEYVRVFDVPYSKVYDMGYTRTGCMFCMFGVHLEKEPNRFQMMMETHPRQYKYCIEKLGLGRVLDYIKIPYRAPLQPELPGLEEVQNVRGKAKANHTKDDQLGNRGLIYGRWSPQAMVP
jgi:3'-phosphoadenosine 5'-phosphosulfate sulfotransferase (PAPS reductase)/FAD synthetase